MTLFRIRLAPTNSERTGQDPPVSLLYRSNPYSCQDPCECTSARQCEKSGAELLAVRIVFPACVQNDRRDPYPHRSSPSTVAGRAALWADSSVPDGSTQGE